MSKADADIRITNGLDYWTQTHSNSLGFLDKEHAITPMEGTKRILFLGDSFVEAAQVNIQDKFHVLLEQTLNKKHHPTPYECIALGRSGSGTTRQLLYYKNIGSQFQADLVILLFFVGNDYTDNSLLMQAVMHGWPPYASPLPFFDVSGQNENGSPRFTFYPISSDWREQQPQPTPHVTTWVERNLSWSRLYQILEPRLAFSSKTEQYYSTQKKNLAQLRKIGAYASRLADWQYPDDIPAEYLIFYDPLPKIMQDAVDVTRHSLLLLREAVQADGAQLLVVATDNPMRPCAEEKTNGRTCNANQASEILASLCAQQHIPFLDLQDAFRKMDVLDKAHFSHDRHWTKAGHAAAAQALFNYLHNDGSTLLP